MRRPSQRTIDLFNQLVEQQNKVRKQLLRFHKRAEETFGAGRLPSLVLPPKAHKITTRYFEVDKNALRRRLKLFWNKYKMAKQLFSGARPINKYLSFVLVQGYRDLWIDQIGIKPEGSTGKYTQEQIDRYDSGSFMEVYNMLFAKGRELFFLGLLETGKIVQFKFIYQELTFGLGERENSWLSQQADMAKLYLTNNGRINPKAVQELYKQAGLQEYVGANGTYSGKHTKKSYEEAEQKAEKAQKRAERRGK